MRIYRVDPASGTLTTSGTTNTLLGPVSLTVDPLNRFVYVVHDANRGINGYRANRASGALTPISGSPFPTGSFASRAGIDPSGNFLYVPAGSMLWGYRIAPTSGALSALPGTPLTVGASGRSVVFDHTGQFAYVTTANGGIFGYSLNASTGALTPIAGSPFAPGVARTALKFEPRNQYAFALTAGGVEVYALNATTGALTAIAGSPFPGGGLDIAFDPSGRFAFIAAYSQYVIDGQLGSVTAYQVNQATGALTEVSGSPYASQNAQAVTTDSLGRYVYSVNGDLTNTVTGFSIDAVTGALTPLATSPYAAGVRSYAMGYLQP